MRGCKKMELKAGEKYLTVHLTGHAPIAAFPNEARKENKKAPHFKADGIAVWVNEKQGKASEEEEKSPL